MNGRSLGLRRVVAAFACALISGVGLAAHAAGADDVAYARATSLARAGRCPEALAVLAEITKPTAASVNLRAQCQLDAKDWPAALGSLEEAKRLGAEVTSSKLSTVDLEMRHPRGSSPKRRQRRQSDLPVGTGAPEPVSPLATGLEDRPTRWTDS
jgi:hypothetical protein